MGAWRARGRVRARRIAARLRYLLLDADAGPIELFTATVSLWFAARLLVTPHGNGPDPRPIFAAIALAAGLLKIVGVVAEWRWVTIAGLLAGVFFWTVLAFVLWRMVVGGITFGAFAILAGAQLLCLWHEARKPV